MPTIIEKTTNGLYKHPERTVTTFPSGLVRIDQSYSCNNSAEATHRATLAVGNQLPEDDGYPAIDGAYIFPHCQQMRRGSGFTEFVASAYGRTTDKPSNYITRVLTIQNYLTATNVNSYYNLLTFTVDIVLPTGDPLNLNSLNIDPEIFEPYGFFHLNQYNSVNRIDTLVSNRDGFSVVIDNLGKPRMIGDNQLRRRIFTVVYNIFSDAGEPTGTTQTVKYVILDPTIKVISQSDFGKFTEYKISVDYNITSGSTGGLIYHAGIVD
jgi:hypothetical protein